MFQEGIPVAGQRAALPSHFDANGCRANRRGRDVGVPQHGRDPEAPSGRSAGSGPRPTRFGAASWMTARSK